MAALMKIDIVLCRFGDAAQRNNGGGELAWDTAANDRNEPLRARQKDCIFTRVMEPARRRACARTNIVAPA
jgi:hypothetical protein